MAERNHLSATGAGTAAQVDSADDRSTEDIRHDIAARRDSITETVDHLSTRFQRTLDWRTYVSEYPLVMLGVAAGAGFLIAGLFKRRVTPRERIVEAFAEVVDDVTDRFRTQLDGAGVGRSSGWSQTVKAAATGVVTKAATDYLRNRLVEHGVLRPQSDDYLANANAPSAPDPSQEYADYAVRH
jgi:ElaB/YqjD/DUF883 family membrane-anchored ribosome-binding protein